MEVGERQLDCLGELFLGEQRDACDQPDCLSALRHHLLSDRGLCLPSIPSGRELRTQVLVLVVSLQLRDRGSIRHDHLRV